MAERLIDAAGIEKVEWGGGVISTSTHFPGPDAPPPSQPADVDMLLQPWRRLSQLMLERGWSADELIDHIRFDAELVRVERARYLGAA
jgi:hypothetical protein